MRLQLVEIATGDILRVFSSDIGRLELPTDPPSQVSPAEAGWEGEGFRIEEAPADPVPEPTRWQISTYEVTRRVIAAGKSVEANALLEAHPDLKFRFLTVGQVWSDDQPMIDCCLALGLDPEEILARVD